MHSTLSNVRTAAPIAFVALLVGCGTSPPASPTSAGQRYTVSGLVSAPAGDVVAGARVQVVGANTVTTDESGRYTIGELTGGIQIQTSKEGYEPQVVPVGLDRDRVVNVTLLPVVRIAPGDRATFMLYGNEPGYDFLQAYDGCEAPCRLVRLTAPGAGTLSITLAPRDPNQRLSAYFNEGFASYQSASTITILKAFNGPGETIVYVRFAAGLTAGADSRIDVSVSFRPAT